MLKFLICTDYKILLGRRNGEDSGGLHLCRRREVYTGFSGENRGKVTTGTQSVDDRIILK